MDIEAPDPIKYKIEESLRNNQIKAIKILLLAVFIDILGLTLLLPLLPFWVLDIGQNEYMFGIIITVYSFFQLLGAPIWGRLSDRFGRRPIILTGLVGNFVGFVFLEFIALFFFSSIELLIISRIIGGFFTSATLPTSQAYISDVIKDKNERTKYYGYIGAVFGLAFTIGPAIGGVLAGLANILMPFNHGYWAPILITVFITVINLFYGFKNLPESHPLESRTTYTKFKKSTKSNSLRVLKDNPEIVLIIIIFSAIYLAFSSLDSVLALFGKDRFGMNEIMTGFVFTTAGTIMIITQGFIIGKLSKKFDDSILLITGIIILTFSFFGISLIYSFPMTILIAIPIAFGISLAEPVGISLLSKIIPPDNRGEILGINEGVGAFARLIGPLLAVLVYAINIVFPWYVDTVLLLFASLVGLFLYTKLSKLAVKLENESTKLASI